ncbi:MAG: dCTP deaminase [Deltaproteobacteria bacterium]|nr:dCTP deaminase [Deltaproteobacteria bacterium]
MSNPAEEDRESGGHGNATGVLSAAEIERRHGLAVGNPLRLSVIPWSKGSVQAASLDVHLGNWFAVPRRTRLASVDLSDPGGMAWAETAGRERLFVRSGEKFVLHPGDCVLGTTREFVALPNDVMAFVEGRSGIGRMGVVVATATQVAPGFHGVIVLELANIGTVPVQVKPEMGIAQLVFAHTLMAPGDRARGYRGRFHCQIYP